VCQYFSSKRNELAANTADAQATSTNVNKDDNGEVDESVVSGAITDVCYRHTRSARLVSRLTFIKDPSTVEQQDEMIKVRSFPNHETPTFSLQPESTNGTKYPTVNDTLTDYLLYCDMCLVCVHAKCYSVAEKDVKCKP
jgi:hypothetical protein